MIYLIQGAPEGPVKIGFAGSAKAARRRLSAMQTAHVEELFIRATCEGSREDEALLHRWFGHARLRGEWFGPDPFLLGAMCDEALAFTLDLARSVQRWRQWGLLGAAGMTLTDDGMVYLRSLESAAITRGVPVEQFVNSLLLNEEAA